MNLSRTARLSLVLASVAMAGSVRADTFVSGPFAITYLAAGLGLPLLRDGALGRERSLRTLDTLAVTFGATEGLKALVRERRPDGSDHEGLPSGHASLAFSVATMEAQFHPREALYWYAGATLIGVSRVTERKHYAHDVLAGAALGYGIARLELSLPKGILLRPFYGGKGRVGMVLSGRF